MSDAGPLAIVWHSRTGAAQAMAEAAAQGAVASIGEDDGNGIATRVCLIRAEDTAPALLLEAAGYLFVCPENLGTMSGIMKDMFDRAYYPLLGQGCRTPLCHHDRGGIGWARRAGAD